MAHQSFSSPDVRLSLIRYIGVASVPFIALLLLYLRPFNVYLLGFYFLGFVGLVILLAYRSVYTDDRQTISQPSQKAGLIRYALYCRNCGYTWQMTSEEWELAAQKERQSLSNSPSPLVTNPSKLHQPFERIERQPPNANHGIFLVIGFVGLALLVPFLLYAVFWAKAHRDHPYALVVNGIGAIFALLLYTGLMVIYRPKTNKIRLLIVMLIALLGLLFAALKFFLA